MNATFGINRTPTAPLPAPSTFALVIGTFAAVAYVHLQLEARRRFYPEVPLLVHDDGSPKGRMLEALCRGYGADFLGGPARRRPCMGDLAAFAEGLAWARKRGDVEVLLKLSRRFIPLTDWRPSLAALLAEAPYPTACAWTTSFCFGFRSECVALARAEWDRLGLPDEITRRMTEPGEPFVEGFLHDLARRAAREQAGAVAEYEAQRGGRPRGCDGYAVWDWMGTDRCARSENFLWHDAAGPEDYATLAQAWGLPYEAEDFADPNEGHGDGR